MRVNGIDCCCKINVRNVMGETPLHSVVRNGNAAVVKLLLRNTVDWTIQDRWGKTVLDISKEEGLHNISQLLIDSGSNKSL